jgi:hypothetical protein
MSETGSHATALEFPGEIKFVPGTTLDGSAIGRQHVWHSASTVDTLLSIEGNENRTASAGDVMRRAVSNFVSGAKETLRVGLSPKRLRRIGSVAAVAVGISSMGGVATASSPTASENAQRSFVEETSPLSHASAARIAAVNAALERGSLNDILTIQADGDQEKCDATLNADKNNDDPVHANNYGVLKTNEELSTDEAALNDYYSLMGFEKDSDKRCGGDVSVIIDNYVTMTSELKVKSQERVKLVNDMLARYKKDPTVLDKWWNELHAGIKNATVERQENITYWTYRADGSVADNTLQYVLTEVHSADRTVVHPEFMNGKRGATVLNCGGQPQQVEVATHKNTPKPKTPPIINKSCPPNTTSKKPTGGPVIEVSKGCFKKTAQTIQSQKDGGVAGAKQQSGDNSTSGAYVGPTKTPEGTAIPEPVVKPANEGTADNTETTGGNTAVDTGAGTSDGTVTP